MIGLALSAALAAPSIPDLAIPDLASPGGLSLLPVGPRTLPEAIPGLPLPEGEDSWEDVWARLELLIADEADTGEAEELARLAEGAGDEPRARLLALVLEGLAEGGPGPRAAEAFAAYLAERPWPFAGRATWVAVEQLPPGDTRTVGVLAGLAEPRELRPDEVRLAWTAGVEEAEEGSRGRDSGGAEAIQGALHRRFGADWSAADLALTIARQGRYDEAARVLEGTLASPGWEESPLLLARRGLLSLGMGDERGARGYLGKALARGSADAAVMLARLDLDAGRLATARAGFRALLAGGDPGAWALRGWGLALLNETTPPERPEEPKNRN